MAAILSRPQCVNPYSHTLSENTAFIPNSKENNTASQDDNHRHFVLSNVFHKSSTFHLKPGLSFSYLFVQNITNHGACHAAQPAILRFSQRRNTHTSRCLCTRNACVPPPEVITAQQSNIICPIWPLTPCQSNMPPTWKPELGNKLKGVNWGQDMTWERPDKLIKYAVTEMKRSSRGLVCSG